MKEYLNSKVEEYSFIIGWLEAEVNGLQARNTNHPHIIRFLQGKLGELRQLHNQLRVIVRLGKDKLFARAIPIIHQMEYHVIILSYHYIPGLQKENAEDIFIRDLVLSLKQRCGLSWVEDVLVRLDGHHAIFPAMPEIPVVFAPPYHVVSTQDMAAIYHELGHDVFQRFKEIGEALSATAFLYFFRLSQSAGMMTPEKRMERDKAIKNASEYWTPERLNEIFSDIYAAHVCGPAYYFSCVDFVLRLGLNPFATNPADVHPPWAGRIYACRENLSPNYQNDDVIRWIGGIWDAYVAAQQKNPDYDMFCPTDLIDQLVDVANQNIERLLPAAQCYSDALEDLKISEGDSASGSLEKILNARLKMLHTDPTHYAEWEKKVFDFLKKPSSPS